MPFFSRAISRSTLPFPLTQSCAPAAQPGVDQHHGDPPAAIDEDARQHALRHPARRDRSALERGHYEPAREHGPEDAAGEAEEQQRPRRQGVSDHERVVPPVRDLWQNWTTTGNTALLGPLRTIGSTKVRKNAQILY